MICASRCDRESGASLGLDYRKTVTCKLLLSQSDGRLGIGEHRGTKLACSSSALGKDPVELCRMPAQIVEPLPDRRDRAGS